MELTDNPLANIFESIPEFEKLSISCKSQIYGFLEHRIDKLALKIRMSPYEPYRANDGFNLNRNFPEALRKWLNQFPPEHKLGCLGAALSATYITQAEADLFLDIGMQRLREEILKEAKFASPPFKTLPSHIRSKVRVYPVSTFGAYDDLVHKLPIEATRDRDRQPSRGMLDDFLETTFEALSYLVEYENSQEFIYREDKENYIKQVVDSFINSHIVIVEDISFSGTRIKKSIDRFLSLLKILFVPFERQIIEKDYSLPHVYLFLILGTKKAQDAVDNLGMGPEGYRNYHSIFGFVFDDSNSTNRSLPENLKELNELLPKEINLYRKLLGAITFFHERYGKRYWTEETQVAKTYKFKAADLRFGYGGDGWTIVTRKNCPNNSLPLLWYPHTDSVTTDIVPLFGRIDSHKSHTEPASDLNETISLVREDRNRYLYKFLEGLYAKL